MKKVLKWLAGLGCLGILIFIGYFVISFLSIAGVFDADYSITELKEHFELKKTEIYELKRYFKSIVPKDKSVYIEFDDDNTLNRFGFSNLADDRYEGGVAEWDIDTDTKHTDSLIQLLGWDRTTLIKLKEKLDVADCIGISSREPVEINFKRYGMGMYSFIVFDKPMNDSLKAQYNDGCTFIYVNSRLALEYSGGAIGGQCFYNLK